MANIAISNLHPVGSDLFFADSESYMAELSEGDLSIQGGAMSSGLCVIFMIMTATSTPYY